MNHEHERQSKSWLARASIAGLLLASSVTVIAEAPQEVMAESRIERVGIEQVQFNDGTVRGVVVNRAEDRIEDLTLRVTYQWRWQDEFNPGSDSPGFSETLRLDTALAPGEQREFTFTPASDLPARDDGHFAPEVSVVSFVAYDSEGRAQASN